jgi:hypothetical protein
MFTSRGSASVLRTAAVLGLLLLVACDDPTALRHPPEIRGMKVFAILDPDAPSQPVLVSPATTEGVVDQLTGKFSRTDGWSASAIGVEEQDELHQCIQRYGTLAGSGGQPRCLDFAFTPRYGDTYRFRVSARDRPTATATATVPGDFEVLEVSAKGDPPGTEGLEVRWTKSEGAYRYLVGLRAETPPWCGNGQCGCNTDGSYCRWVHPDRQGWFAVTTDTVLSTVVSGKGAEEIADGEGPWYVEVYAVDKAIYEYLTTGTSGDLFPVPPVQNVEGGYGAVGAWVRRSMRIR